MARRNRIDIIHDILSKVSKKPDGLKKTHILYQANLSHNLLNLYMEELIGKEFLEEHEKKKIRLFRITDKGLQFLEQYDKMKEFENAFGL